MPAQSILGNLDAVSLGGQTRFILELNRQFALAANAKPQLTLQDLCSISARIGIDRWHDPDRWFSYKITSSPQGSFALARSLSSLVGALYGRTKRVLVLDLDNTLWGGVIGDDGPERIVLGRETPLAEAYIAFQEYCLKLRGRGILLAVCSKNNENVAKQGFIYPDSLLKIEHFSAFRANWEPKHANIQAIAQELNLGVDSFVFVDDDPAERAIVEAQVPGIEVPDVGSDVTHYAAIIEAHRYFEPITLGKEDLTRAQLYQENAKRAQVGGRFADYGEYLDSLEMTAEIGPFNATYLERIAQLTNRSNQFNLTTKRFTLAELEATVRDDQHIGVYGRLSDRFGDNGLVSVVLGRIDGAALQLDLWLMSCRVLKREMEIAMLDGIALRARARGLKRLIGHYQPSSKNGIAANHYEKLGFTLVERDETVDSSCWSLDLATYEARSRHIKTLEPLYG